MAKQPSNKATIDALKEENTRLEAEVARLRNIASLPAQPTTTSGSQNTSGFFRKTAVVVCMVLAVLLLVLGNLFFWAGNTLVNQDRFVAATAPVIQDKQVQQTLALYTTNQIFAAVDVQHYISEVLPPRAAFLAPQLSSQVRGFTQTSAQKALAAPKFQQTWNNVIAHQHERIIAYAKTYQGNGTISLNDVFQHITTGLGDTKLSFLQGKQLPSNIGSVTLVTATWLPPLHNLVNNIGTWRILSILGLVIFTALAVWLSRKRRKTIFYMSLFMMLGLFASLVALRAAREHIVDQVQPAYQAGVARAIQIMGHSLLVQTSTIIAAIVILGLITWISGGAKSALATKRFTRELFTDKLHRLFFAEENTVTTWIHAHKQLLEWITIGVFIFLMLVLRLTVTTLIVLVILLVLFVLAIEILGDQAPHAARKKT